MKFTLSWLKDHLETDKSLEEIADTLTAIGLEVEAVDNRAGLNAFMIARVLEAEKHPDADKLQVLKVDAGDGRPVQVVCGAPNARAGLIGVFAPPGTYVPGLDTTLAVGKIRGVESLGMMCSGRELLLSDDHSGIIELPGDAPVGTPFAVYAGLNDPVIDISLTPNRADCAGVHGIARDLAAAGIGTLKEEVIPAINANTENPVKVTVEAAGREPLCLGFAWRLLKNIKNGPSPKWLQQRLTAIGLRPVNALVDITNYLTFDQGRPLHVFDADKIQGKLTVRPARDGEKLLALNGKEYALSTAHCVIADERGVLSISGIMGGQQSGCDDKTTNVIVESALWDARAIARTGRELGIISDARYRFERGVDPDSMLPGLDLATHMMAELCGGTPTKAEVTAVQPVAQRKIAFPLAEIKRLTSLDVPEAETRAILTRLGFRPEGKGKTVTVTVPGWRPDIHEKADLVEEVMRIYGIERITPQPLASQTEISGKILTSLQIRSRDTRRALASRGMMEVLIWPCLKFQISMRAVCRTSKNAWPEASAAALPA